MTAGFTATVVISLLMLAKSALGLAPDLNPIKDIVAVVDSFTGMALPADTGWLGHFVIGGVVWGVLYAWLEPLGQTEPDFPARSIPPNVGWLTEEPHERSCFHRFDSEAKAEEVRNKVLDMQKEYLISVEDAVIARATTRTDQTEPAAASRGAGALSGAFWGMLTE